MKAVSELTSGWGCPRKTEARKRTVIDRYRNLTGRNNLPSKQQYWTMCGQLTTKSADFEPNSELGQVVSEKLIKTSQFYGVELDKAIHAANIKATKGFGAHLFQGDIIRVMDKHMTARTFNPGLVNLDTMNEPELAARLMGKAMCLLNLVPNEIVVFLNFVKDRRHMGPIHQHSIDEIKQTFAKCELFQNERDRGCWLHVGVDTYRRGSRLSTTMMTVTFVKKAKQ